MSPHDPALAAASPPEPAPLASDAVVTGLNRTFTKALSALKDAGERELACRLAAEGWALLWRPYPEAALSLEKLLHRLTLGPASSHSSKPRPLNETKGDSMTPTPTKAASVTPLEVRHLAPAQRHALILETCAALPLGGGIELINDHDPKPLRYQFDAETPGQFSFTYVESGPEVWRVRIDRIAAA